MKRTILTRLLVLVSVLALLLCTFVLGVAATDDTAAAEAETAVSETQAENKNPTNEELGGFFSAKRIKYAVLVSVQGMVMIFLVLSILWGVVSLMKVFLHDIPEKKAAKQAALAKAVEAVVAPAEQVSEVAAAPEEDEGEIVAAITAAIAAMLQSEEYKGQFESGFRVVSFTRKGGAWNKKN